MKMNKIFAAGIAATLAVTSLASVASAEVAREFDMKNTIGKLVYEPTALGGAGYDLGKQFAYTVNGASPINYSINDDTTGDNVLGTYDYYMDYTLRSDSDKIRNLIAGGIKSIAVTINGKGMASNGATTENLTQTATLEAQKDAKGNIIAWRLPIYAQGGPIGSFIPERFVQIDSIKITIAASDATQKIAVYDKDIYKAVVNQKTNADNSGKWSAALAIDGNGNFAPIVNGVIPTKWDLRTWGNGSAASLWFWGDGQVKSVATGATVTDNGAGTSNGLALCAKINELLQKDNNNGIAYELKEYATEDQLAWMPKTTIVDDGIILRNEVDVLSSTGDYASAGVAYDYDYNQTYEIDSTYNYNKGTGANGFAGLASQIADFFNQKTNGKIAFHFTAATKETNDLAWNNGGIPSTEVGLRNFLESAKPKDFALFVNYNTTTGSLQADATLDPYASEVIFDISDILKALGGQTIGTVQDIYYALDNGASTVNGVKGLYVDKVTLSYDEAAAADTAAADDEATDDETDVETVAEPEEEVKEEPKADDKADEIEIPDDTEEPDDDATVVIEEPDDAQTVVDNTADNTVVVNPGTTTAPAADENPHTGVALAVVPAALAAAAMVISKKRK